MIQRNVVFQSKTDTGESVLNMPITVLKNIEDTAEIKDNISDDDYVPVIDSSDNSQMKKTNFKNAIASKADKSDVEAALDNKSDVNHIHDERYYTESEVDTKLSGKIDTTLKGSANGIAELNENGKVPSSQLPSYVDAVVEYTSISDFPSTGDTGKIYVDTTTNLTYRWSGSAYVEISPSIALGETSSTAYRGDRGKAAYDHISDTTAHITAEERAAWDAKADLSDIPTELPANGGNADTVNGHTVESDVPANAKFTDTKVTNTLAKTTKAYVTGTTSSSTNTGTQVFDTGVYLDTTAGQIVATTFKGALSGNASTATALTSSAGTTHIPVRFSNGKPVAVSEILKYNTGGSLPHGNTTISYASGYKYALIFAYLNHPLGGTDGTGSTDNVQPLAIAWVGNMSSTTSYAQKPLTQSGPQALFFKVTNGDIILYNNGGDYYGYLIIWSN